MSTVMQQPRVAYPNVSRPVSRSQSRTDFILCSLMVLHQISLGSRFDLAQYILEMLIMGMLVLLVSRIKLSRSDALLLITLILVQCASLLVNDFYSFALNLKVATMGVLSYIYFRGRAKQFKLITFVVVINLLFVVYQMAFGVFPLPGIVGTFANEVHGRPLGLFMSFTASAAVVAVYFLGTFNSFTMRFVGMIILLRLQVATAFLAYVANWFGNRYARKHLWLFVSVIFGGAVLISVLVLEYLSVIASMGFYKVQSLTVIAEQLSNIVENMSRVITWLPAESGRETQLVSSRIHYHSGGIEIGYLQVIERTGLILGIIYLVLIIKHLRMFSVFLIVSLFHVSFVFSPLVIYMMILFTDREREKQEKEALMRIAANSCSVRNDD